MNHYVYRITNTLLNKHYYGVRTSKCEPEMDLGIKYFSTSKDKEFIKDQKENSQNYKYKVIRILETRVKAMELEIYLHKKFNVKKNKSFYNKSNQTTTKFDFSGVGEENPFYGKNHTEETRKKMKENHYDCSGDKNPMAGPQEKLTCPYCKKDGGFINMNRYHMENCKYKNNLEQLEIDSKPKVRIFYHCEHCGVKSKAKGNITRFHNNNCKKRKDK